jgi:hypothetical protein
MLFTEEEHKKHMTYESRDMLHFVMNFMKNRKFRVAVGAEMSTIRNIGNEVVGAVLSVTLFLISMSQINKNVR